MDGGNGRTLLIIPQEFHRPMKHFDFGKNWISFSRNALTRKRIELARSDFLKLFEGNADSTLLSRTGIIAMACRLQP